MSAFVEQIDEIFVSEVSNSSSLRVDLGGLMTLYFADVNVVARYGQVCASKVFQAYSVFRT